MTSVNCNMQPVLLLFTVMNTATITIARYTLIESLRNRFIPIFIAALVICYGLAGFLSEMAITESREMVISILSFSMRLFSIITISLFVITNISREFNDRILWHIFSLARERYIYYSGKLLAFSALSFLSVIFVALLLLFYVRAEDVLLWSISLFFELMIVTAFSLLCMFTFRQITLAFLAVMGFYLLARNIATFQLISSSPILETNTSSQAFIDTVLNGIAYVLPALNDFAHTSWLVYGEIQMNVLGLNALQCLIYLVILSAAAIFDLYRMEL